MLQPAGIGGAEAEAGEFAHPEGRVAAVAGGAAKGLFAVQKGRGRARTTPVQRGRNACGAAANHDDIRPTLRHGAATSSGVARRPLVIAASVAWQ
jgi:hypothetical protein